VLPKQMRYQTAPCPVPVPWESAAGRDRNDASRSILTRSRWETLWYVAECCVASPGDGSTTGPQCRQSTPFCRRWIDEFDIGCCPEARGLILATSELSLARLWV